MDALTEFHIAGHSGECECGVCETLAADEKEGA